MSYEPKYRYIPPADFHILTKLYDTLCFIFGLGKRFKRKIVRLMKLSGQELVLDVGCGTGVLLEIVKKSYSDVRVIGIDPDETALEITRSRVGKYKDIKLIKAFAESLPLESSSVDVCVSSLALHHVPDDEKLRAITEMYRVLKKDGRLVIADFGKTNSRLLRKILFFEEYIEGNFRGLIMKFIEEAGFKNIKIVGKNFPGIDILSAGK